MNVKDMIRRLTEIAAMADGDDIEVVLKVESDGNTFYYRCCPELVELKNVRDASFIPGEYYQDAENDDLDEDVLKAVTIRTNAIQ